MSTHNSTTQPATDRLLVGAREVAAMLDISLSTLQTWCCQDRMPKPYYRIGRTLKWRPAEVEAWLETQKVPV